MRSDNDIRLQVGGRLVRDRAGNVLFARDGAGHAGPDRGLQIVNGLYVKVV